MSEPAWWRRFLVRGVFWRQILHWAVLNVPIWIEPVCMAWCSMFFLLWGPGRHGVMRNLAVIKSGSSSLMNFLRTYRVFWNYAWTITDNARLQESRVLPDWEFTGHEHFASLQERPGGAIMLTAHMGSYDLGALVFGEKTTRKLLMVRAPEADPQTREFEHHLHDRAVGDAVHVNFNTRAHELALDLLEAVQQGHIVAIQGDRVTPGIASIETKLFGMTTQLPSGPFALAMAARVPIYPIFVFREGRRRYRLVTCEPITVERAGRNRDEALESAVARWASQLERIISQSWFQWFTFEPVFEERHR